MCPQSKIRATSMQEHVTLIVVSFVAIILLNHKKLVYSQLSEYDRLNEYHKRNYTWPITQFRPSTEGWKRLILDRLEQVRFLNTSGERYEAFYQTIHTASVAPNFTEYGFGLGRCPDDMLHTLQQAIYDGLSTAGTEALNEAIESPQLPLFIERWDLTAQVLRELQPYAEAWSNVSLVPQGAYGFRLYRNESKLFMHVDKIQTHIISMILHIDSSEDSDPWPIYIEDFHGNTHEVVLTPGDILFYESSKCFHGRPKPFKGSWYSSVFIHYYPVHWDETNHVLEAHYAVPPIWKDDPPKKVWWNRRNNKQQQLPMLALAGTTMREPECPNNWCHTMNTIQWSGPGETGYWIAPDMKRHPLIVSSLSSIQNQELDTMSEL
jgi:hypothetical protein